MATKSWNCSFNKTLEYMICVMYSILTFISWLKHLLCKILIFYWNVTLNENEIHFISNDFFCLHNFRCGSVFITIVLSFTVLCISSEQCSLNIVIHHFEVRNNSNFETVERKEKQYNGSLKHLLTWIDFFYCFWCHFYLITQNFSKKC